jgi:hypothetical protein
MAASTIRIGRPARTPKPGERVSLGLKVTPTVKTRIDALARQNGRTQSQEAELRLEQSFRDETRIELFHDAIYGSQLAALLELTGRVLQSECDPHEADWLLRRAERAEGVIREILAALCQIDYRPADGESLVGAGIARTWLKTIADAPPVSILSDDEPARFGRAMRSKLGAAAVARMRDRLSRPVAAEEKPS